MEILLLLLTKKAQTNIVIHIYQELVHWCPSGFWQENPAYNCCQYGDLTHYSQHSEMSPAEDSWEQLEVKEKFSHTIIFKIRSAQYGKKN